jgi:hypothetical protein
MSAKSGNSDYKVIIVFLRFFSCRPMILFSLEFSLDLENIFFGRLDATTLE